MAEAPVLEQETTLPEPSVAASRQETTLPEPSVAVPKIPPQALDEEDSEAIYGELAPEAIPGESKPLTIFEPMPQKSHQGKQRAASGEPAPEASAARPPDQTRSLARNYYRAGKDYYDKGDLSNAARSLENAVELGHEVSAPEVDNAARLLDNVRLAQGQLSLDSRAEKAAGAQVQKEIAAGNVALEQTQQTLLEQGLEASREGRADEARAQLRAAAGLRSQLVAQGADAEEQSSRLKEAEEALQRLEEQEKAEVAAKRKKVQSLKKAGRYDEALETARSIQNTQQMDEKEDDFRDELEGLTVLAARDRAQRSRVERKVPSKKKPARKASFLEDLAPPPPPVAPGKPTATMAPAKPWATGKYEPGPATRAYDVRTLVQGSEEEKERLLEMVRSVAADATGEEAGWSDDIRIEDGKLLVTETPELQDQVNDLLDDLEAARGPQVELGVRIARQQAEGLADENQAPETGGERAIDPTFQRFVERNYAWQLEPHYGWQLEPRATPLSSTTVTVEDLYKKAQLNLGQKVDVDSINLGGVDAATARGLEIRFSGTTDTVSYALVDEAQFRTLMEMDAQSISPRVSDRRTHQEVIVGTDALLANGKTAQVVFAGEEANRLNIQGIQVEVPLEHYLLIDNVGFLTALRTGPMQHWTRTSVPIRFATVPQNIDVPLVGRLVKFEKTLVKPSDELVIQATYFWKGQSCDAALH